MKRNRHTEEQVISILKPNERGVSVAELARQNGVGAVIYDTFLGHVRKSEAGRGRETLRRVQWSNGSTRPLRRLPQFMLELHFEPHLGIGT